MKTNQSEAYAALPSSPESAVQIQENALRPVKYRGRNFRLIVRTDRCCLLISGLAFLALVGGGILWSVCNDPNRPKCSETIKMAGQITFGASSALMLFFICCCCKICTGKLFDYQITETSKESYHSIVL